MNLRSKLGFATVALLCVGVTQAGVARGATVQAGAGSASRVKLATVSAADTKTVVDARGQVYDSHSGDVVTVPQADVESATASNLNGQVSLGLGIYDSNPNPITDAGWLANTPANTVTAVEWVLATSTGQVYTAVYTTHATAPTSGIVAELFNNTGNPVAVSCLVTPTYSATAGYGVHFSSSCIGNAATFAWNGVILYHPANDSPNAVVGKAAPEQGSFPKKLLFAPAVTAPALSRQSTGYWLFATDGGVFTHGSARFFGSTGSMHLNQPIVGSAPTSDGNGYWLVASDGGIFSFGDARFYGSTGSIHLNEPIVGMTPTPDGSGYWLVASDGGIFAFGTARFFGSTGGMHLNKPIVGMAATPDGKGYWLVASDGGIFAFGDAAFHGSTGGEALNKPILGMTSTADGQGYWLVASDGGIFAFGDAAFHGSTGSIHLNQPIVGIAATGDGGGYWLVASDGGIFAFGDAVFYGSQGSEPLNKPIVTMAAATN